MIQNEQKILVVEDNPEELKYAKKILERAGKKAIYEQTLVGGIRALKKYKEIDTVITDVFYPVGGEINNSKEFYEILGNGLFEANVIFYGEVMNKDKPLIPTIWTLPIKEISKIIY